MATYKVEFRKSVQKDLRAIPKRDQIRILRRISNLADDPRLLVAKNFPARSDIDLGKGTIGFYTRSKMLCL